MLQDMKDVIDKIDYLYSIDKGNSLDSINLQRYLLIQLNNGKYPLLDSHIELMEKKIIDDIEIFHWKLGAHYYAKYKGKDVVVDGEQKWCGYETALRKAKEYVKLK